MTHTPLKSGEITLLFSKLGEGGLVGIIDQCEMISSYYGIIAS
jgi:hypothetical protein